MTCSNLPADYRDARQALSPHHRLTPPLPVRSDREDERADAQGTPER